MIHKQLEYNRVERTVEITKMLLKIQRQNRSFNYNMIIIKKL